MLSERHKINHHDLQELRESKLSLLPNTLLTEAIALMSQHRCSCILIESEQRLEGIFTERDLVKLIASETNFAQRTIAEVMTKELIINELVVNSLEHGFVNRSQGEIKVSFKKQTKKDYNFTIRDNGSGIATEIAAIENHSQFLGLSLVKSLVIKQLKGTLELKQDNGLVISITFPIG